MIIAIDTNCILPGRVGGIENYTLGLIEAIKLPQSPVTRTILLTRPENHELMSKYTDARTLAVLVERPEYHGRPVTNWADLQARDPAANEKLSEEFRRRKVGLLHKLQVDVVHFPGNTVNPLDLDLPIVLNLHDIQFRHFPQYYTPHELAHRERYWAAAARRADAMVVASDFIRDDLKSQLRLDPKKMFVTPEPFMSDFGSQPSQEFLTDLRRRCELPELFFFYPAVPWEHKNHRRLIDAFLQANIPGSQLVLSGGGQENSFLPGLIAQRSAQKSIRLIGRVTTEELVGLYHLATALIFPSEFEAWSIPIMEAMACACPVASSNATSLPQEVGDAGLLFDPRDISAMASAMRRLAADTNLCQQLSVAGREQVKNFGPAQFVRTLAQAYSYARTAHLHRKAA